MNMKLSNILSFVTLLSTILVFTSCADEQEINPTNVKDNNSALFYNENEICNLASDARTAFFGVDSRSNITIANIYPVRKSHEGRSKENDLLYVVNFDENKGFAVVSADKTHNSIYAVTDCGNLSLENNDNPGLQDYLDRAVVYANNLIDTGNIAVKPPHLYYLDIITDTIYHSVIKPVVKVQWGQDYPYNTQINLSQFGNKKPKAGCVAIAAAQALTYFEYPLSIKRQTEDCKGQTLTLDWSKIKKHIRCDNPTGKYESYCTKNITEHNMISALIFEIGSRINTLYGLNLSTAHISNLIPVLTEFGYNVTDFTPYGSGRLALTEGSVLIMGSFNKDDSGVGHAYIIDGKNFYKFNITKNIYDMGPGGSAITPKLISSEQYTEQANYVHINWGLNGLANGYYYDKVFDTEQIYQYDSDATKITNDNKHFSYSSNISFIKITR